jgi:hypothetical protein
MALFPLSGVLREFSPATHEKYASASTLVRPCSEQKMLISELETVAVPIDGTTFRGWALAISFLPRLLAILPLTVHSLRSRCAHQYLSVFLLRPGFTSLLFVAPILLALKGGGDIATATARICGLIRPVP